MPRELRDAVARTLGARVVRAARVWGGYSPSPTFRLLLADGRRAFVKATGPEDNAFAQAAFARETRIYEQLGDVIAPWAPLLYGSVTCGEWWALVLEDLGAPSVPPWRRDDARAIARAYAEFHQATLGASLPEWLPQAEHYLARESRLWEQIAAMGELEAIAGMAGERAAEALRWLEAATPLLARVSLALTSGGGPHALLHGDTRSDNLRWTNGRLRLFDWPHAGIGVPEYDLGAFAQSVTLEGGLAPEEFVDWYAEVLPARAEQLDASVAAIAAFFADLAWRPAISGLPRLRPFQRAQLCVTLDWTARRLRLPTPTWLNEL
jgi:Ser/Thr protein kinase RdoA (MazF antagonist)